jgi:hypothetical protein
VDDEAPLTKADIIRGLNRLDELARLARRRLELTLYGGAAMILCFEEARDSTRDIDVVIKDADLSARRMVLDVGAEFGWPISWMNDAVSIFTAKNEETIPLDAWGDKEFGLVAQTASPEYLFAMKSLAARFGDDSHDLTDIAHLARHSGIESREDAIAIIKHFYPDKNLRPNTAIGLRQIFHQVFSTPEYQESLDDPESLALWFFHEGLDPREASREIEKRCGEKAQDVRTHLRSIATSPHLYENISQEDVSVWADKFSLWRLRMTPEGPKSTPDDF